MAASGGFILSFSKFSTYTIRIRRIVLKVFFCNREDCFSNTFMSKKMEHCIHGKGYITGPAFVG